MNEHKEINLAPFFRFRRQIYGPDGMLKYDDWTRNTVVTAGKNLINDTVFMAGTAPALFVGLKGTGAVAAGDTMATHAGWTETTVYTGPNRKSLGAGTATGGTSVCTPGTYAMTGTYTAAGAFVTSGTVIGGTVGTLYSAGDFSPTRTGGTGDTLIVTPTLVTA